MNATTFFTEDMFNQLKKDITAKKVVRLTESPYGKEIKVNGNTYELRISTGHYVFGDKEYFISGWVDHSYTNKNGHRNIGGGNYLSVILDNWEAFKNGINRTLEKFPDYKEEVFEPVQLCWF